MEEKILDILSLNDKALEACEIEEYLGLTTVDELKELLKVLNKLEEEYKIYRTKKNKY